jgi:hypothetical protein
MKKAEKKLILGGNPVDYPDDEDLTLLTPDS